MIRKHTESSSLCPFVNPLCSFVVKLSDLTTKAHKGMHEGARWVLVVMVLCLSFLSWQAKADDAPLTYAGIVSNATAGVSVPIPVTVQNFTNIGQFTITLEFDITRITYVSATNNPSLTGMTATYQPPSGNNLAHLIFSWTGTANVSLTDGAVLSDLVFTYLQGTSILRWTSYGYQLYYKRWVSGSLVTLNDNPEYLFYFNGGISNRTAPVTFAPVIYNPTPGSLSIPITANDFLHIGSFTLYLEYESTVLTYQNTFTPNPALASMLVGSNPGTGTRRYMVMQWYGTDVTLDDGAALCTLDFVYSDATSTNSDLAWYDIGYSCEYADASADILIDMPAEDFYINGYVGDGTSPVLLNIILNKENNCGEFNVKLKPLALVQGNLTEIIFTVRWAASAGSDVQLTDIVATWPGLALSGSRVLSGGYYYVTFASQTTYAVNWAANSENTIMTFRHSGTGEGNGDFTIIANDYSPDPPGQNTGYYVELASSDATGSIVNNANGTSYNCGLYVKDFLQGPYLASSHLMRTNLATGNYLPFSQPYTGAPWAYAGTEQVASYPAGAVDWVLVELRTGTAANTVISRRAGFLKNDGTLMDLNGSSPLVFHSIVPGNAYYVVIYHRSHMPVMTATAITLPNTGATKHDFTTNPAANVYSATSAGVLAVETDVYAQIAGELKYDNILRYSGANNDRSLIFTKINAIYTPPPALLTSSITGYYAEDVNMDGIVRYSGAQNDQGIIFSNIDALTDPTVLLTIYQGQVPVNY